jgi:hypothetical protein
MIVFHGFWWESCESRINFWWRIGMERVVFRIRIPGWEKSTIRISATNRIALLAETWRMKPKLLPTRAVVEFVQRASPDR